MEVLRWLKSGLSRAGLFEGEVSLYSLFIARNSLTSPGSSRELLDIWSKLSEESRGLPEGVCIFFFFVFFLFFWCAGGINFKLGSFSLFAFCFLKAFLHFFAPLTGMQGTMGPGFL